jgi:hypothetical protein
MSIATSDPATITIRMPVAPVTDVAGAPAFVLDGPLSGRTIGLRSDLAWRSWQFIARLWAESLRGAGAEPVEIMTAAQVGKEGTQDRENIDAWSDQIDAGIVGLGTCGSCTSFSVHDAVTLESHRKPSIVVVASEFETHARNMARFLGHPDLKVLVLPYPLEARPEAELRTIADDYYPQALSLLGVHE